MRIRSISVCALTTMAIQPVPMFETSSRSSRQVPINSLDRRDAQFKARGAIRVKATLILSGMEQCPALVFTCGPCGGIFGPSLACQPLPGKGKSEGWN